MVSMNQVVPVERPQGQVEAQVARMDSALEDLENGVQGLIAGLTTVLRSEPPTTAPTGAKVGEVLVPLASHINGVTERLNVLSSAISGARSRLEL